MFTHGIDPVLVTLGPISIRYYGLAYVIAFIISYYWLQRRDYDEAFLDDLIFYGVLGVVLGGRIGYFLFYNPMAFLRDPVELLRIWNGGMAFHGGLIGAILGGWYAVRLHNISYYDVADDVAIPALIGLGLGRVANFINGEIVGTVTDVSWCVVFPGFEQCRHPVQLYLACKNWIVAFGLYWYEQSMKQSGLIFWHFILWYAVGRFILDFWRFEPNLFFFSMGQYLTLAMIAISSWYLWKKY